MIKQFAAGNCYSYVSGSRGEALIIDPHVSLLEEYRAYLGREKLVLKTIIDTHTHADHFSLSAVLKKEFGARVLMHEKAVSDVADGRLKDNDYIDAGDIRLRVIYTPGHTDDAISLYGEGRVFTGDVLLIGSVGRTDFQNGSPESMFDSLQKLKALPAGTVVSPGHDYNGKRSSTIKREKAKNPFLKQDSRRLFVENMRSKAMPKPFNMDNIVRVNQKGEAGAIEMVPPETASELSLKDTGTVLLDVRSAIEFSQAHIGGSVNVPLEGLASRMDELSRPGKKYIVLCRTGNRSPMAADMLMQAGINEVKVMQGGMEGWKKEKLPVVKGAGGVSLERQVRIIAGSLVLSGALLSWLVHWAFIFMPVFAGSGLIYAGVSDNCLMGILLMKLPYNKKVYKSGPEGGTCSISVQA